ncbi:MAG: TIGR01777 family oxidoreductase [Acidobacteriota bacterium]
MVVVIAGGSGFLGRALHQHLGATGHAVRVLTRRPDDEADAAWTPDGTAGGWAQTLDGVDALVNLSGAGIADRRWTRARKDLLRTSRLLPTRSLVAAVGQVQKPPAVFIQASASGRYGPHADDLVTEDTPPGADFLSTLSVEWEREVEIASRVTRTVCVRTGLVLHPDGGVLKRMLPPFRIGLGGRLGSGTHYMPWIHRDDWVALVLWLISSPEARGAFNATAPEPVTNAEFTRTLGAVLRRPAILPAPALALKLIFGELATALLTGQRAVPARAESMGFTFRFRSLEPALRDLLA